LLINIDVDDTIADLKTEWLRRYNNDYNDSLTPSMINAWDLDHLVKPECGEKIYDYLNAPDLYEGVRPIAGALYTVQAMRKAGHEITFVTANTRGMCDQKWQWLVDHKFIRKGRGWPKDVIICNAKYKIEGHLFIDDKAEAIIDWVSKRKAKAIILDYPWNRADIQAQHSAFFSWCTVARDWNHIRQIVGV
jgi:5'-nucleotidase